VTATGSDETCSQAASEKTTLAWLRRSTSRLGYRWFKLVYNFLKFTVGFYSVVVIFKLLHIYGSIVQSRIIFILINCITHKKQETSCNYISMNKNNNKDKYFVLIIVLIHDLISRLAVNTRSNHSASNNLKAAIVGQIMLSHTI